MFDASRPGKAPGLEQQQKQRIIAVVCSPPPEGRARWTVRLQTEEDIKRKLVPRVGREAIRILLESHDLKPWREKMWCVGELNDGTPPGNTMVDGSGQPGIGYFAILAA